MTDVVFLSQLPPAAAVTAADIVPITQGSTGTSTGTTRRATMAQIAAASQSLAPYDPSLLPAASSVTGSDLFSLSQASSRPGTGVVRKATATQFLASASVVADGTVTSRLLTSRFAETLNAFDFGAIGNGLADDKSALDAAMTAARAAGKPLKIAAGIYLADGLNVTGLTIIGDAARTIIKCRSFTAPTAVMVISGGNTFLSGLTIDGNAAGRVYASYGIYADPTSYGLICDSVKVTNCKNTVQDGLGQGILLNKTIDFAQNTVSILRNVICRSNGDTGLSIQGAKEIQIIGGDYSFNATGISVQDGTLPQIGDTSGHVIIDAARVVGNTSAGINTGSFPNPLSHSADRINVQTTDLVVCNCYIARNGSYGLVLAGNFWTATGNVIVSNGITTTYGGVLADGGYGTFSDNIVRNNYGFGVDGGAGIYLVFDGNSFVANAGIGLNVGAGSGNRISSNMLTNNTQAQITVAGIDSPGGSAPPLLPFLGVYNVVENNTLSYGAGASGISLPDGPGFSIIRNNWLIGAPDEVGFIYGAYTTAVVTGNKHLTFPNVYIIASASTVVVPDWVDEIYITGTNTVTNIITQSQSTFANKVAFLNTSVPGSGYTPNTNYTLAFSGGAGSGVAGYATTDSTGGFYAAVITSHGAGYTSAPTVSLVAPGSGVAASFSAQVSTAEASNGRQYVIRVDSGITLVHGTGNLRLKGSTNIVTTATSWIRFYGLFSALEQVA